MAFRTIPARYPGTCRRCEGPIEVGSKMRYGGRGLTYHLAAECPVSLAKAQDVAQEVVEAGVDPVAESDRINAEWAEQKDRFAEREAAQEREAFEAKAQRDEVLMHYMRGDQ